MNAFVFHIASGQAFFSGTALIVAGLALIRPTASPRVRRISALCISLGLCLAIVSATPAPWPLLFAAAALTVAARLYSGRPAATRSMRRRLLAAAAGLWLGMAAYELRYHLPPAIPPASARTLFVIGDSVSAGMMDPRELTWPKIVADEHSFDVRDFSRMGATAGSALQQASRIDGPGLVLLEIGGNDLLGPNGGTPAAQFERDLDALLTSSSGDGRTLVMLELPLPPLCNRYGEIQRRLSRRHGVILIPKRVFLGVLTTDGATVDSIHLSRAGQKQMAETLWSILAPAFPAPAEEVR